MGTIIRMSKSNRNKKSKYNDKICEEQNTAQSGGQERQQSVESGADVDSPYREKQAWLSVLLGQVVAAEAIIDLSEQKLTGTDNSTASHNTLLKNGKHATQHVTNSALTQQLVNDTTSNSISNSASMNQNGKLKSAGWFEYGKQGRKSRNQKFGQTLLFVMALLALLMTYFQLQMGIISTGMIHRKYPGFDQADKEKLAVHKIMMEQFEFSENDISLTFLGNLPIYAIIVAIGGSGTQRHVNSGNQRLFSPQIIISMLTNFNYNLPWYKVVELGENTFTPRRQLTSVVFKNKLCVAGGDDGLQRNDVWSSPEGTTWKQIKANNNSGWPKRYLHTMLVFKDELFVIAGKGENERFADVWKSPDGDSWELLGDAEFQARSSHASLVQDDKMWVIAGWFERNDAWQSTDGINWTEATQDAFEQGRHGLSAAVQKDEMYVAGGGAFNNGWTYQNDVQKSTDGATWNQVKTDSSVGFTKRFYHSMTVQENKLYIIGGYGADSTVSDFIQSSTDGENWTEEGDNDGTVVGIRDSHTSQQFDKKLWIISGNPTNVRNNIQATGYDTTFGWIVIVVVVCVVGVSAAVTVQVYNICCHSNKSNKSKKTKINKAEEQRLFNVDTTTQDSSNNPNKMMGPGNQMMAGQNQMMIQQNNPNMMMSPGNQMMAGQMMGQQNMMMGSGNQMMSGQNQMMIQQNNPNMMMSPGNQMMAGQMMEQENNDNRRQTKRSSKFRNNIL